MKKFVKVLKNRRISNYRGLRYADVSRNYELTNSIFKVNTILISFLTSKNDFDLKSDSNLNSKTESRN